MSALEDTGTAMALERGAFLERLDTLLRSDMRILAAWVGGSVGRGEADALSDIDIHLAIADDRCEELNVRRQLRWTGRGGRPPRQPFWSARWCSSIAQGVVCHVRLRR